MDSISTHNSKSMGMLRARRKRALVISKPHSPRHVVREGHRARSVWPSCFTGREEGEEREAQEGQDCHGRICWAFALKVTTSMPAPSLPLYWFRIKVSGGEKEDVWNSRHGKGFRCCANKEKCCMPSLFMF